MAVDSCHRASERPSSALLQIHSTVPVVQVVEETVLYRIEYTERHCRFALQSHAFRLDQITPKQHVAAL